MKHKLPFVISCVAVACPIILTIFLISAEPELAEAICGGVVLGCAVGSILGTITIILNKGQNRIVNILSVIPMIPLGIYLVLLLLMFFRL